MKKLSKRERNELRIKAESKAKNAERQQMEAKRSIEKKKKPKIHVCYHCTVGLTPTPGVVPPVLTTLKKISDEKCRCYVCEKEYPIAFIEKMNKLIAIAIAKSTIIHTPIGGSGVFMMTIIQATLRKEIKPIKYYKDESGNILYIDD